MGARRILVNASYAPSLLRFRGALMRHMVEMGHSVVATAPDIQEDVADGLRALGVIPREVMLSRTGLNPLTDFAYREALRSIIRDHAVNLVLGYTIKPCIWGSLAAAREGVESVSLVTGLGFAFTRQRRPKLKQWAMRQAAISLWRRATRVNRIVIFQNPDDRDDFIAAGALSDPGKARLVDGSGVDPAQFPQHPLPREARFLMMARLLGSKGTREYAEAVLRLIAEGSTASFALAGYFDEGPDGVGTEELDRWIAAGLNYLGPLQDVGPALADCSVFVLPSYREGTPRSVLEAMATGRAIITTDVPGCRETVVAEESGLLVEPRDIDSLAAAMRRLAQDETLRARLAEAAYRRCLERFGIQRVNAMMMGHLGLANAPDPAARVGVASGWPVDGGQSGAVNGVPFGIRANEADQ